MLLVLLVLWVMGLVVGNVVLGGGVGEMGGVGGVGGVCGVGLEVDPVEVFAEQMPDNMYS